MKEVATKRLIELREEIHAATDSKTLTDPFLVLPRLLPNGLISKITSTLLHLTQETLNDLIGENETVKVNALEIWTVTLELQSSFKQQLKQKADKKEHYERHVSRFSVRLLSNTDDFRRHDVQTKRKHDLPDIAGQETRSVLLTVFDGTFSHRV